MTLFRAALWAEALKARRSKVPWLTALGLLARAAGRRALYDHPQRSGARPLDGADQRQSATCRRRGRLATMLSLLAQATAVGGGLLFTLVTTWVFGREFSDHTAKELLALPTPARGDRRRQVRGRGHLGRRTDGARAGARAHRRRSGRAAGMVEDTAVARRRRSGRHRWPDARPHVASSAASQRGPRLPPAAGMGVPHGVPGADPGSYRMGGVVSVVGASPL